MTLFIQVSLIASAFTLAVPQRVPRLLRTVGSTTLGAYVFQGYLRNFVDANVYEHLMPTIEHGQQAKHSRR